MFSAKDICHQLALLISSSKTLIMPLYLTHHFLGLNTDRYQFLHHLLNILFKVIIEIWWKVKSFLPFWVNIFPFSGVQQQGAVAVALLTTDTGGFGSRECFMWLKCITTDYISVSQFLALMLWKSANPSDKEVCNKKLQNFHSECFMEMFCFLILVFYIH